MFLAKPARVCLWNALPMNELPVLQYRHLKRLADLRRCPVDEAVDFLFQNVEPSAEAWIDLHWGEVEGVRKVDLRGRDLDETLARIEGLPRDIRPVTDGPYLEEFEFFEDGSDFVGIRTKDVVVMDFLGAVHRDEQVFELVRDLLPPMSVEQYRILNTFNSQYLRLVRQPDLFTMPRIEATAVDAGCYVGYKALALASFVGESPVLAFELEDQNFELLGRNVALNAQYDIRPIQAALSDERIACPVQTRNVRSMAHSLESFDQLKERNTQLTDSRMGGAQQRMDAIPAQTEVVQVNTSLLDDYTSGMDSLSAVHISVNGHECEVLRGGSATAEKADILRISCPYKKGDRMVRDLVRQELEHQGVELFGLSGAALVAGREQGTYHAKPF